MMGAGRKKILLVEDDVDLAQLYRGVLRMSGFDSVHVVDGMSALRALEEEEVPDLIVVDMNLPVLNGDQLLQEIAARPDLRQIPAIVVTGADIRPDVAAEQDKHILRKTCSPDRLVSAVERYVRAA